MHARAAVGVVSCRSTTLWPAVRQLVQLPDVRAAGVMPHICKKRSAALITNASKAAGSSNEGWVAMVSGQHMHIDAGEPPQRLGRFRYLRYPQSGAARAASAAFDSEGALPAASLNDAIAHGGGLLVSVGAQARRGPRPCLPPP